MESASAGSGKRAGDGPFALTQLLSRPGYGSPARRAAAHGTSKVPVFSSLFAATPEEGGGPASAADWTSRWPNARPSTCFEAPYKPKRIAWSELPAPGRAAVLRPRPDEERLRMRQPSRRMTARGQRVAVWPQASGAAGQSPGDPGRDDRIQRRPGRGSEPEIGSPKRIASTTGSAASLHPVARQPLRFGGRLPAAERCHSCGASSTEHRAPSAERRAPSSEHRASSAEQRAPSHDHRGRRAAAKQPDHPTRSAGRGLGAAQRGSSGQSPGNPGREDRVSAGRAGGASRRWALRSDSPPHPARLRLPGPSRGSPRNEQSERLFVQVRGTDRDRR
jgi:hypothetical protein